MGRRERPLPPGPLYELAHGLRELRAGTGMTYRALARKAGYSASALSAAASGDALPTLEILLAYAEACGGGREEWSRRWHEVAATEHRNQQGPESGSTGYQPGWDSAMPPAAEECPPDLDAGAPAPDADAIPAAYPGADRHGRIRTVRLAMAPAVLAVAAIAACLTLAPASHGTTGITARPTAQRTGSPPSSQTAVPGRNRPAASPAMLGAPDWKGYCATAGHGTAQLTSDDAYGWHCTDGAGIDGNAACAWTYGYSDNQAIGRIQDFYDQTSWQCWRVSRELGAPDFNGYCRATRQGAVQLTSDDAYGWHCADGAGIDGNAVCAWTYGRNPEQVTNRFEDFYDPNSWQCWA